ncbi:MAG: radical SAM protein [Deltaproteobacteria bacterium]|jgi:radical SAM protein (TIGR04043 family)|nr:MAG: radical SAM protein [Deltaproteobacteria bacterium]
MDSRILKVELQSYGLRIPNTKDIRRGGAGPTGGIHLRILPDTEANIPVVGDFVNSSPYYLDQINGEYWIFKDDVALVQVELMGVAKFYNHKTSTGIPMQKIGLLHCPTTFATTLLQTCVFWEDDRRCKFCGIELTLKDRSTVGFKNAKNLVETILLAKELDGISNIVFTSGVAKDEEKALRKYAEICSEVKRATGLPIQLQIIPPEDLSWLGILKDSGVDALGVHIETFDPEVFEKITPGKARIGFNKYIETWKEAVRVFGRWQVSTYILVGLGERLETVIEGAALCASIGVYPFVVPFRPIAGTPMENVKPPRPEVMEYVYTEVAKILSRYEGSAKSSKAGCVSCGECSALPDFEKAFTEGSNVKFKKFIKPINIG